MIDAWTKRPSGAAWLGAAFVLGASALAAPFTVDDAFIVARYAENLAAGRGYAMNPHAPSDGVTGPLWLAPFYGAHALGLPPLATAKIVGALCAALAAVLAIRWAGRRALGRRAAWATAIVLACSPDVATWAVSGLETGAALLAVTGLAYALLARGRTRWATAICATTALAWLRPELAPCAAVLWLARVARGPRGVWRWLALAALGALSVVAFRLALFGDVVPLSARAKPADLAHGASYAVRSLVVMTSLAGAGLAVLGARAGRGERAVLLALAAHLAAVVLAGGDWMPGGRLFVPVYGLYALLVGRALARLSLRRPALAGVGLALAVSVPLVDFAVRVPELRASERQRETRARALAGELRALGGPVALLDAGYLAYASGLPVVDLGGLTDRYVARLPGGHIDKRIDEAYLRARDPNVIVLHAEAPPQLDSENRLSALAGYPVERRVAAMAWVRASFRVHDYVELRPGYGYVVLVRAPHAR